MTDLDRWRPRLTDDDQHQRALDVLALASGMWVIIWPLLVLAEFVGEFVDGLVRSEQKEKP